MVLILAAVRCGRDQKPAKLSEPPASASKLEMVRWNFGVYPASTEEFRNVDRIFWTRTVSKRGPVSPLHPPTQPFEIRYEYEGTSHDLEDFAERTNTLGLLLLHGDSILLERYWRGSDETSRFIFFSVSKSVVSTLIGIARGEGLIQDLNDPIDRYLPELRGSGYEGVPIKAILQMSSGIRFTEDYEDYGSDIAELWSAVVEVDVRLNKVAATFPRERPPFERWKYISNDTQILGWLISRVSGKTLSAYMQEKLWGPLGTEDDCLWIIDYPGAEGMEMAFGGLTASIRDLGRFGLLMASDGLWRGQRLLPEGWVREATIPDSPQVQFGRLRPDYPLGYQYQWWCLPGEDGIFTGKGVHGQFLTIDPRLQLVMVKTSNLPVPWRRDFEYETYAFFNSVRDKLRKSAATAAAAAGSR